jgi:hypothetical protein
MSQERPSYTLDEARALLPEIRATLLQLALERRRYAAAHATLHDWSGEDGDSQESVAPRSAQAELAAARDGMHALMEHLEARGVQVRDLDEGLVDIPTIRDGEPAWFCWRLADPQLSFWHTTREGFSSRRPL